MKTCTKCKKLKPMDDFSFHRFGKNHKRPECKSCEAEYRRSSPVYRETKKIVDKRRDQNKVRGYRRVYYAVSKGILPNAKSQICKCGKPATHYHHPNGYDDQHLLDVIPLCCTCHRAIHANPQISDIQ